MLHESFLPQGKRKRRVNYKGRGLRHLEVVHHHSRRGRLECHGNSLVRLIRFRAAATRCPLIAFACLDSAGHVTADCESAKGFGLKLGLSADKSLSEYSN